MDEGWSVDLSSWSARVWVHVDHYGPLSVGWARRFDKRDRFDRFASLHLFGRTFTFNW